MQIGNIFVENPLILGPMAGVTDWAFRTVCAKMGANITVTEMVSSRALVYKDKKSAALLRKNEGSICGAQIFGNDPAIMAEGAKLAMERLMEATETIKPPKYYNGKVVCIDNCHNRSWYTVGKIYTFVDGVITNDEGSELPVGMKCHTFRDWAVYSSSKWLEIKE